MRRRHARIRWALFATTFLAFASFHQGGGWNQNARFAMVRAVVEEGTFSVDSFLVYGRREGAGEPALVRALVRDGRFSTGGRRYALWWRDAEGQATPVAGAREPDGGAEPADLETVACTGDVSFHGGRFYPNKPPGGSLAAVPAYFVARAVERATGVDADGWRALTVNAWLSSALSVGLVSALGCVLFFQLALDLSGGRAREAVLATLALAFGTMFFPYATALYEHNLVAVSLLASFFFLRRLAHPQMSAAPSRALATRPFLAGAAAGFAVVANYAAAVPVLLLFGYLVLGARLRRAWIGFSLGLVAALAPLAAYHAVCFGTPFTTSYAFQSPAFKSAGRAFLGVFQGPDWGVLVAVLASPFRGLFVGAPVLLMGVCGWLLWWRRGERRAEVLLTAAVCAWFLAFVMTFNGWHGGWAVGPRYLVPALPFLALPSVAAFARFPRTSSLLLALSVAVQLLVTAVDPQSPLGVSGQAVIPGRPQWAHSPVTEYVLPLFVEGRAEPLVRAQRREVAGVEEALARAAGEPASARAERAARVDQIIEAALRSGEPAPLVVQRGPYGQATLLPSEVSAFRGPVSVNPVGVYESWMFRLFPPRSVPASWNSFNVGEMLFPGSRWSLAPLIVLGGLGGLLALRLAKEPDGR